MVNALFAVLAASSISLDLVSLEIGVVLDIVAGSLALVYWSYHKPDYVANARPLGVSITAVESGLIGIILVVEAIILLFLPVVGILGVLVGAVGVGFFELGKGLWDGKGWAQEIMMLLSVIGIIVSLVLLPRGGRESDPITVPALVFATAARFSVLRGGDLLLNETSSSNGYVFFRPS